MSAPEFDQLPWAPTFEIYLSNPLMYKPRHNFLFRYLEEETALTHAVKIQNIEAVAGLLYVGADPNQMNLKGVTPISLAAYRGSTEVMLLLIHAGADVNYLNYSGSTPLIQAAHFGHESAVRILLDHNAGADFANTKGTTALMRVSQEGHVEIGRMLLGLGVDVNRRNNEGMTSLMLASQRGHASVAAMLVDNNAAVDEQTTQGSTALMLASKRGHMGCVEVLLSRGAELQIMDKRRRTARDIALKRQQMGVLPCLSRAFQNTKIQELLRNRRSDILFDLYAAAENGVLKLSRVTFVSLQLLIRHDNYKGNNGYEHVGDMDSLYSGFVSIVQPSSSTCYLQEDAATSFHSVSSLGDEDDGDGDEDDDDDLTDDCDCDGSLNEEEEEGDIGPTCNPNHRMVHVGAEPSSYLNLANSLSRKGIVTSVSSSRPSSAVSAFTEATLGSHSNNPQDELHDNCCCPASLGSHLPCPPKLFKHTTDVAVAADCVVSVSVSDGILDGLAEKVFDVKLASAAESSGDCSSRGADIDADIGAVDDNSNAALRLKRNVLDDSSLYLLNPFPQATLCSSAIQHHSAAHQAIDCSCTRGSSKSNSRSSSSLRSPTSARPGCAGWQWPLILHRCLQLPRVLFELIVEFMPFPAIWKWSMHQLPRRMVLAPRDALTQLCDIIDEILGEAAIFVGKSKKLLMIELNKNHQMHESLMRDRDFPPSLLQALCSFADVQSLLQRTGEDELTFRLPIIRQLWIQARDLLRWHYRQCSPVHRLRWILANCTRQNMHKGIELLNALNYLSGIDENDGKEDNSSGSTSTATATANTFKQYHSFSNSCHSNSNSNFNSNSSQQKQNYKFLSKKTRSLFDSSVDQVSSSFAELEEEEDGYWAFYDTSSAEPPSAQDSSDDEGAEGGAGGGAVGEEA